MYTPNTYMHALHTQVGVGLTRKNVLGENLNYFHVITPPVLVHGTFDFQQFLLLVLVSGLIHTHTYIHLHIHKYH
jgi:hypothetical protein